MNVSESQKRNHLLEPSFQVSSNIEGIVGKKSGCRVISLSEVKGALKPFFVVVGHRQLNETGVMENPASDNIVCSIRDQGMPRSIISSQKVARETYVSNSLVLGVEQEPGLGDTND